MISKELRQVIEDWYVLKTYGEVYENLHRDIQADINHYFDATGNYGQVLSDNDWAALCKEWAYTQGYTLLPHKIEKYPKSSYLTLVESIDFAWDDLILSPNRKIKVEEFFAGTEPEAIFKACQWIYDNRGGETR